MSSDFGGILGDFFLGGEGGGGDIGDFKDSNELLASWAGAVRHVWVTFPYPT